MINALFVYGTLMPGQCRWAVLAPWCVGTPPSATTVNGQLYDTGWGWPAAVLASASGQVPGVLVHIEAEQVAKALAVLDEVEGCPSGLFERRLVTTVCGTRAWAYSWPADIGAFERIQAWGR